jgi:flagellar biosynthesis/type III secretory pathway protein FliH
MIDDITTMYDNAMKKAKQEAYNKGLEDGKKGV